MNIVHILFCLDVGGAEIMLVDIINEQVKSEHVTLIVINDKISQKLLNQIDNQIKVILIGRKEKSRNPLPILKLNWHLLISKPDVIHCHNDSAVRLILIRKKVVLTVHDMNISTRNHKYYKQIFAISNAVKADIENRSTIKPILVYNGINVNQVSKKEEHYYNTFNIFQISRLDHIKKGQDILLEAIRIIVHEKGINNIKVDFIGTGDSIEYLKKLVKDFNIESYINFLGMCDREQIYECIKNYNLLVQPSLYEGFGLTIIEAMAAKVPVLVSDIEGPMEVIENGHWGFYFTSEDSSSLASKIIEIMGYDQKQLSKNAEDILKHVLNHFDVKMTAKNYIENYQLL